MALPVTALYAGLMGLWLLALAFAVMSERRRHDVSVGDAGVPSLQRAVRAHGNAVEYVPIALILLGLAEGMGMPGWLLHLAGLALTVGRGLHGWYFLAGATRLNVRVAGMLLTVAVIALLSVGLVFHALARLL
jgi:uncharacterized membrane protein YecN with MAPEG domain